jgi:hypothetical protein
VWPTTCGGASRAFGAARARKSAGGDCGCSRPWEEETYLRRWDKGILFWHREPELVQKKSIALHAHRRGVNRTDVFLGHCQFISALRTPPLSGTMDAPQNLPNQSHERMMNLPAVRDRLPRQSCHEPHPRTGAQQDSRPHAGHGHPLELPYRPKAQPGRYESCLSRPAHADERAASFQVSVEPAEP